MTRAANARLAGAAFLVYIAAGLSGMALSARATAGNTIDEQLLSAASHQAMLGARILLALVEAMCALVLAVTLRALTREEDEDLALLAFACRVGEGLLGALPLTALGFRWLATTRDGSAPGPMMTHAVATTLVALSGWKYAIGATLFAIGSAIFCWLFLRARTIPRSLAWLGLASSLLLGVLLPLQLARFVGGPLVNVAWGAMALFEVVFALWLLVTGAAHGGWRRPVRAAG